MPKPKPEDYLEFFKHITENQGKDFKPETLAQVSSEYPYSPAFDEAFFASFPASKVDEEIVKADDYDRFLEEHDLDMKVEDLGIQEQKRIKERRNMLLRTLTLLEWARKAEKIPENTTLLSLFKWVSEQAKKINTPAGTPFSVGELNTIYLLKALVELKSEGMEDSAIIPDIIKVLDQKYEALKGEK